MSDEIRVQTKGLNKKFLFVAITLIAVGLIAALALLLPTSAKAKKVEEQLDLGAKYLSELNYEQAIVAYEAVIKIDPKCEEAYLALADIYIATGAFEKAEEILKQAEKAIGAEAQFLEEKRQEVLAGQKQAESTPIPSPTELLTPTSTPIPSPTATPMPTPTEIAEQYRLPDKSLEEIIYQGMDSDGVISWGEIKFIEDPFLQTCLEWKDASIDEIYESLISSGVPERNLTNERKIATELGERMDDWISYVLWWNDVSDSIKTFRAQFSNDTDRLEHITLEYVQDEKIVKIRDVKIADTIETVFQKLGFKNSEEIAKFSNELSEVEMEDAYNYLFASNMEDRFENDLYIYPISYGSSKGGLLNGIGIQFARGGVLTVKELKEMSELDRAALSRIELWFDYNDEEETFMLSSYEILLHCYALR